MKLITTSDVHGAIDNLPRLSMYLWNLEDYLLLDAGDMISGTYACWKTRGELMVTSYNQLNYDAVAIGNHEFDYGFDVFLELVKKANFPFLSCNIFNRNSNERPDWAKPYTIVHRSGKVFGIIGATTQETPELSNCKELANYDFKLIETHVCDLVRELRNKVDYIILLAHKGVPTKGSSLKLKKLATKLIGQVDVIIGGHTHGTFSEVINGIPVIQTKAFGLEAGQIDLTDGKFTIEQPVQLSTLSKFDVFFPIPNFKSMQSNTIITKSRHHFELDQDRIGPLDYILVDMFYFGVKNLVRDLDGVLLNKGSIRSSIKVGDVGVVDIFNCMPFGNNEVVVTTIPGYELKRLIAQDTKRDLIPANMSWAKEIVIDGHPLQEMRAYRIVMSDYLARLLGVEVVKSLGVKQTDSIVMGAGTYIYLEYCKESRVKK